MPYQSHVWCEFEYVLNDLVIGLILEFMLNFTTANVLDSDLEHANDCLKFRRQTSFQERAHFVYEKGELTLESQRL